MTSQRRPELRFIIPENTCPSPTRITCRLARYNKPPLSEGESQEQFFFVFVDKSKIKKKLKILYLEALKIYFFRVKTYLKILNSQRSN